MRRILVVALAAVMVVPFLLVRATGDQSLFTALFMAGVLAWFLVALAWRVVVPSGRGEDDRAIALDIQAILYAPVPPLHEATPGYTVARQVTVGEVVRHFAQETSGAIEGWIDHRLGLGGWGVGVQTRRLGLGTGKVGLKGQSQVHLSLSATTRANLVSDGWIAVLETSTPGGLIDVVRLVVPSEAAVFDLIGGLAASIADAYGAVLPQSANMVIGCSRALCTPGRTNISYVGDRLTAFTRIPADQRPPLSVMGVPLGDRAILGGALRFGSEDQVHQLVPFVLIQRLLGLPGAGV